MEASASKDYSATFAAIRKSSEQLSKNFHHHITEADFNAWNTIIYSLQDHDATTRFYALKALICCSCSLLASLHSISLQTTLINSLCDILVADESEKNRNLAVWALAQCSVIFKQRPIPKSLEWHAFNCLLSYFIVVFPPQLLPPIMDNDSPFSNHTDTSSADIRKRVYALRAMGGLLDSEPGNQPAFLTYIDHLFQHLLHPTSHYLLQREIIYILTHCLSKSNANRTRVELLYKPVIATLYPIKPNEEEKVHLHPSLLKAIYSFWSTWFAKPTDDFLLHLKKEKQDLLQKGYAGRRLNWLQQRATEDSKKSKSEKASRKESTAAATRLPYATLSNFNTVIIEYFNPLPDGEIHQPTGQKVASVADRVAFEEKVQARSYMNDFDHSVIERFPKVDSFKFSFNTINGLIFTNVPYVHEFVLHNKGSKDPLFFFFQVSPSTFFKIEPSFCYIQPLDHEKFTVTFTPNPYFIRHRIEISGFLRLRTLSGITLERIPLKAYNVPLLKLDTDNLDFGFCPINQGKNFQLMVENMSPLECNCAIFVMPSPTKHFYIIDVSQTVLQPKSRKMFDIGIMPSFEGIIQDMIVVTATGGEVHRINVKGSVGNVVDVLDDNINFGSTHISPIPFSKTLVLRNNDTVHSIPVGFETETKDFVVNNREKLILAPGEEKKVKLDYFASLCGQRQEKMVVVAPNSECKSVSITTTTGPILFQPIMEDIFFTPVIHGSSSNVIVPLVNPSVDTIQILITLPKNSPFTIHVLDKKKYNHYDDSNVAYKPYDSTEVDGTTIILGGKTVAAIEIRCVARIPGTIKSTLQIQLLKPRKWSITTLNLYAICIDMKYVLKTPNYLSKLRRFFRYPSLDNPDYSIHTPQPQMARADVYSSQIHLDPDVLEMYTHDDRVEYVFVLSNESLTTAKYNIVLSTPFITKSPLSGELKVSESTDIVISLPEKVVKSYLENSDTCILYGSILVTDEKGEGLIGGSIEAVIGELISVDAYSGLKTISFPSCKSQETVSRTVTIRNKTSLNLRVLCSVLNHSQGVPKKAATVLQNKNLKTAASAMSKSSVTTSVRAETFSVATGDFYLKPYGYYEIEVSAHPTSEGRFTGTLQISYIDSITQSVEEDDEETQNLTSSEELNRQVKSLELEAVFGSPSLTFSNSVVDFGDARLKERISKSLVIFNTGLVDAFIVLSTSAPFSVAPYAMVPMTGECTLEIACEPSYAYAFHSFLTITSKSETFQIPLHCRGGLSQLTSSLAEPVRFNEEGYLKITSDKNVIDFGLISSNTGKRLMLDLINNGNYDMTLKKLTCEFGPLSFYVMDPDFPIPDNLLWTMIDATHKLADVNVRKRSAGRRIWNDIFVYNFDSDLLDSVEYDWDEIDNQLLHLQEKINLNPFEVDKSVKKSRKKVVTGVVKEGIEMKMPEFEIGEDFPNLLSVINCFPFWIPPYQKIPICLLVKDTKEGDIKGKLKVDLTKSNLEDESFFFWVRGRILPGLSCLDQKIDFGVQAIHSRQVGKLRFKNVADRIISWKVDIKELKYSFIDENTARKVRNLREISAPLQLFPSEGKLIPGWTQTVDVIFKPTIPQCNVDALVILHSEDFEESQITIHGLGASSLLECSSSVIEFGVIRVNSSKFVKVRLSNKGILSAGFFIECNSLQFSAEPEQGHIEGGNHVDITIRFTPKSSGKTSANLIITPHSSEIYTLSPLKVRLEGSGGYPELIVGTKVINYGTALFGSPNSKPITVRNNGQAEATVIFHCLHPSIHLEGGDAGQVTIAPGELKNLNVVYTPTRVEYLDMKCFIRSTDSRGDTFCIALKGNVGVPKLTFDPPNALDNLDLGIKPVGILFVKTFVIKNEGNFMINFTFNLSKAEEDIDDDEENKVSPPCPFSIEPASGSLEVGDSISVSLKFLPNTMEECKSNLELAYEFRNTTYLVKGTGGKALLSLLSPFKFVDFGICRSHCSYFKEVVISNSGNYWVQYRVRPEPSNKDWSIYDNEKGDTYQEEEWVRNLHTLGFRILNPDGTCYPQTKTSFHIEYHPLEESHVITSIRVFFGDSMEEIQLRGWSFLPKLVLYDKMSNPLCQKKDMDIIEMGVQPIKSEFRYNFKLVNEGPFSVDFLIQPIGVREFDIFPRRGYIESGESIPLNVYFRPEKEATYQVQLKIIWELNPMTVQLVGIGGRSRLEFQYCDSKDLSLRELDFGMLPFTTFTDKSVYLHNSGFVDVAVKLELDQSDFKFSIIGKPVLCNSSNVTSVIKNPSSAKKHILEWCDLQFFELKARHCVLVTIRFQARVPENVNAKLMASAEGDVAIIKMKGKGGTLSIAHIGDLNFGDISCNYTYQRKLNLKNYGSIPAQLSFEWSIVGYNSDEGSSYVELEESYNSLDPRGGWARTEFLRRRGLPEDYSVTTTDRWSILCIMVTNSLKEESNELSREVWSAELEKVQNYLNSERKVNKKKQDVNYTSHFKRRQMFYHLISSQVISSQSNSLKKPFISVEPSSGMLIGFGDLELLVKLHLNTEDTFLATLVGMTNVPGAKPYEIPITATPRLVSIYCSDTRCLNFYRQPLGETVSLFRTFKNCGHKVVKFSIKNSNPGLQIFPSSGLLNVDQEISVEFIFQPLSDAVQTSPITFQPEHSQPIHLPMFGGGGVAKASISRYKRFDFGNCMIGKDTEAFLPIKNEGNAVLHIIKAEIYSMDTYFAGKDWPQTKLSLLPDDTFNLPILFHPQEENPPAGKLFVSTKSQTWEIELIGYGKEAVLIISKYSLEFTDCILGNTYEQQVSLKNVGEVNYPVQITIDPLTYDLVTTPSSVVIDPYSEVKVSVSYSPSKAVKCQVNLKIISPYSDHLVPISLHSGTATIEVDEKCLDFGKFERGSKPEIKLNFKNIGTVKTAFHVRHGKKPAYFHITGSKGMLVPKKSAEVTITYIREEVGMFDEVINILTDLVDKQYPVQITGRCQASKLIPTEFDYVNFGVCPVMKTSYKIIHLKNYGDFPLTFSFKYSYPLNVKPSNGTVGGEETQDIEISWNPSGSYELRTHMKLVSSCGSYIVTVHGRSSFPEIAIRNQNIDFGVCGVGFIYRQTFSIFNKGKVPFQWAIPKTREVFTVSENRGTLEPKTSCDVDVVFKPPSMGRFASNFVVECRGLTFKEVFVNGVGGVLKLDIFPPEISCGECPCDFPQPFLFSVINNGDITVNIKFEHVLDASSSPCEFIVPEPILLKPRRKLKTKLLVIAREVAEFKGTLFIATPEKKIAIPIIGKGTKIQLSANIHKLLLNENSQEIPAIDPLQFVEPDNEDVNVQYQTRLRAAQDLKIVQRLQRLMVEVFPQHEPPPVDDSDLYRIPCENRIELENALTATEKDKDMTPQKVLNLISMFYLLKLRDEKHHAVVEDPIIQNILDVGNFKIKPISMRSVLLPISPNVEDNISIIVSRPPPFLDQEEEKSQEKTQVIVKTWKPDKQRYALERHKRNSKAVDFFSSGW